ncbi:solute carrier organic anion transporter family member 2B1-like [Ylistrum balloti]|uniref:solute carrier organic anion transporter family member 2B1-like n=1 Tax=Ylistrum balloti TaxID=509963 RepID=UPI002905BB0E|nr:solute carrier organic anion transporter family member 2B1-like [Ylistrum balloti]
MESEKTEEQNQHNGHVLNETSDNEEDDFVAEPCGIGPFRPSLFKNFGNIPCFVGCYSIIGLLSQSLNTYLGSQIPSIEKQFGLSSAYSGILMSFNDIGYLAVVLLVSSIAPYVHIPRMLFGAFLVYGISGVVCSLPHFFSLASGTLPSLADDDVINENLSSTVRVSSMRSKVYPLCDLITGNTSVLFEDACVKNLKEESDTDDTKSDVRTMFLAIFGIGMVLQGVAKSLRGPFVTVYVDDNGEKRKTGFYMGIIIAVAIAGPSVAFVVGGVFSKMYVTLEDVDITPRDPRWIGAWWIGFLMFGGASIVFAMPMALFPRHIKKPKAIVVKGKSTKDMELFDKVKASTKAAVGLGQTLTARSCSTGCDCKDDVFFPVCGSNGVNYHSPCFAGCPSVPLKGQNFNNCTCIPDGKATSGECQSDCVMIYPFAVLCVIGGLLNALLISPGFIAKLRCVEDRDKATALGCMAFLGSILGWMPTPIIIGKVIDTTCIIWQDTCTSSGACLYYVLSGLRLKVHGVILGYKIASLAFLFLAFYLVRNLDEWPQNMAKKCTAEKDVKNPVEMKSLVDVDAEVEKDEKVRKINENCK